MSDLVTSYVRTVVPVVVGLIVAWAAKAGIDIDDTAFAALLDAVFIGGYYALARGLERRWPRAGWLLGRPAQPTYDDGSDVSEPA